MTELEKCERGNYEEIDFQKLAKEISAENEVFLGKMYRSARGGDISNSDILEHFRCANNLLLAMNAFATLTGITRAVIPYYAGAMKCLAQMLLDTLPEENALAEDLSSAICKILRELTTMITTKIPIPPEDEE